MKNRFNPLFQIVAALSLAVPAHAAPTYYYWDGTDTTAAVPDANGGAGAWDSTLTNWNVAATLGTFIAWPSSGTENYAVFGGSAGTVTVAAGGVTANSLTFNTANYILQGGKITLDGTTPTITNAVAATINSEIGGTAGLTKTGAGTLTLGAANSYTGVTTLNAGTLFLSGGNDRLATAGTVAFTGSSSLNLGGNSQTLANLTVGSVGTVSNVITNGSLTLSGASNLVLTPPASPTTAAAYSLDASGLSSLIISKSANSMTVGGNSAATAVQTGTFKLSSTSNTITVATLNVGTNGGNGAIVNGGTLSLGTANVINATNVQIGSTRSNANLSFQTGLTNPTATLRGVNAGTERITKFLVGVNGAGGTAGNTQIADFSLGSIDARITDLFVSQGASAAPNTPSVNGTFTMGIGTLDATTIAISDNTSGGGNTANTGTFNQNAGTVTVGTLTLGRRVGAAANPRLLPSYYLGTSTTTGILKAATIQAGGGAVASNSARNINFNNGTIQNYDSATNLVIDGSATAAENRINIVLAATGTHTFLADASRTITLGPFTNVSGTSGTLTKTGAGTLILAGTNSYTGATDVRNGTLQLTSALNAATALNLGNGTDSGKVILGNAAALAQTVVGLTSTGSGTTNSIVGSAAANSTLTVNLVSGSNTFGGVLGGGSTNENNLAIVKTGAGTLSLSGANTYVGGTAVDVGGLTFLNSSAKPITGITTVASGATLGLGVSSLAGFFNSSAINSLFSGTLDNVNNDEGSWVGIDTTAGDFDHAVSIPSSTRGLRKLGANILTLSISNAHSGATAIDAGTLRITNAAALGTTATGTTVALGATLAISGGLAVGAEALSLTGDGVSSLGAIRSISGVNSMSGAVTLAGATRIGVEADTLEMSGAFTGTQALTTVGAGKLILSGGGTFGQLVVGNSAVATGGHLEWKAGTGTTAGSYFGVADNVSASFTMSGGSLTVTPTSSLFVGNYSASGVTGTMNVTGGTFTMNASKPIYVGGGGYNGEHSGNGVLNISDGTFSTGTTTDVLRMGANTAGKVGNGEINLSGGILETARSITKGAQGTATVNFDGGTYKLRAAQATMFGTGVVTNVKAGGTTIDTNNFNGTIGTVLAAGSPSGGLTKLGEGTLTLANANTYTGGTTVTAGALALDSAGALGATGTITMNGGGLIFSASNTTDYSSRLLLADGKAASFNTNGQNVTFATAFQYQPLNTASLVKTGTGVLTLTPNTTASLAGMNTSGGTLEITSGDYTVTGSAGTGAPDGTHGFVVSRGGTFRLNGGNVTATSGAYLFTAGNTVGGSSNFILDSGTFNADGREILNAYGAAGTTTINGGLFIGNGFKVTQNVGILNLNGGTLRVNRLYGDAATSTINFNGGTLQARQNDASFIDTNITNAFVQADGAIIDSGVFSITIPEALTEDATSTGGGLTKQGSGVLTLGGANTYTGVTTINAGTISIEALGVGGAAGNLGAAAVAASNLVFGGGTLQISAAGAASSNRGFTINAASSATFNVSDAAGALTLTGSVPTTTGVLFKTGVGLLTLNPGAVSQSLGAISVNGGELILKSGTYATTTTDSTAGLSGYAIGAGARAGTLTIDGATLNIGTGSLKIAATMAGNLSIKSGTVTSNDLVIGHNGSGVATQSGGTVTVTNLFHQDAGSGSAASSYTLTNGNLTARRIYNNTATSATIDAFTLNLNGGTLKSASGTTNLIDNQNTGTQIAVLLGAGNTIIDTTASNAIIVRPMGDMPSVAGTFTKAGNNSLALTAANTYSGGTTVAAGILLANNSTGSGTGSGAVNVTGTAIGSIVATLGGTGTISGATTIGALGKLSPTARASGSKLSLGSTIAFTTGSIFNWDLSADSSDPVTKTQQGNYGQVAATGAATGTAIFNIVLLGGTGKTSSFADPFWNTGKSWNNVFASSGMTDLTTLFTSFTGAGLTPSGAGSTAIATAADQGYFSFNGSTTLTWTAVPEPTSALAGLLITAGLLRRRRQA